MPMRISQPPSLTAGVVRAGAAAAAMAPRSAADAAMVLAHAAGAVIAALSQLKWRLQLLLPPLLLAPPLAQRFDQACAELFWQGLQQPWRLAALRAPRQEKRISF